ncbi:hypothetical protein SNE40_009199 [Patella caerulea]|uniref:Uncharacterized protein n=1 Tax=Patella caerulea TaxID=87958 RepID=A0AAN8Q2T6_PATCE
MLRHIRKWWICLLLVVFTTSLFLNNNRQWDSRRESCVHAPSYVERVKLYDQIPFRHVVFIKVHKAASTTVMNIMLRYGLKNNLTIMLPKTGTAINQVGAVSEKSILPSLTGKYDILCNHVIYNRTAIGSFFPRDTKYVTVIREPFNQFVSAFQYYRHVQPSKYLLKFSGSNPLQEYLTNPSKYEGKNPIYSFTNNRMSIDLGYSIADVKNSTYIKDFLKMLNKDFDLVMLVEYFDESMILLRRTLNWDLKDVLYISSNVFPKRKFSTKTTASDRKAYERLATADYALYEYFYRIFWRKIFEQGTEFLEEVRTFRKLRMLMSDFCRGNTESFSIILEETDWNPVIVVTKQDCYIMLQRETSLINYIQSDVEYMAKYKNLTSIG